MQNGLELSNEHDLKEDSLQSSPINDEKQHQPEYPQISNEELEICIDREKTNRKLYIEQEKAEQNLIDTLIRQKQFIRMPVAPKISISRKNLGRFQKIEFPKECLQRAAEIDQNLVPIRIEIELEGYKLRDTFTWNSHGNYLLI